MCAKFVVAVDFGTTYSGHAVHIVQSNSGNQQSPNVSRFDDWPNVEGPHISESRRYCKTITALYYEGDQEQGRYELRSWGWPALDHFTEATKLARRAGYHVEDYNNGVTLFRLANHLQRRDPSRRNPADTRFMPSAPPLTDSSASSSWTSSSNTPRVSATRTFGCYVTQFKLDLIRPAANRLQKLPGDLTTERLIEDYLRSLVDFIMERLKLTHDNTLLREEVEWCITVPSIWDVTAKEVMKACADKAGLGNLRAEPPLQVMLEREGASVYCQLEAVKGPRWKRNIRKGDKMMIVDVGGGTIDVVVQEKTEEAEESIAVKEVVGSYGDLGGGTYVDAAFVEVLAEKIGRTGFEEVCRQEPDVRLRILGWWQKAKKTFDGSPQTDIALNLEEKVSGRLDKVWREEQARLFGSQASAAYDECLWLEPDELRQRIFDPEVNKVLHQITFSGPRPKQVGDPGAMMCRKVFDVLVRKKGDSIPTGFVAKHLYKPGHKRQESMRVDLYSTLDSSPTFTNATTCKLEGGFQFGIVEARRTHGSNLLWAKQKKGDNRQVEIGLNFGASSIEVSVVCKNFLNESSNATTFVAPIIIDR
ncbi:hypothetical protein L7F22_003864 [Adiantum nelumboides]|nr:hypothetical protein [Adiantum nelumboides]